MLPEKNNFRVITFGCRLNFWETEVIKDHLDAKCSSQITVFNTCSVTSEAERKAKKAIRKIKALNPHSKILVTGCAAQINPEAWSAMPEVNYVVGNKEKVDKNFWTSFFKDESLIKENIVVSDIMTLKETSNHLLNNFNEKTRCFLQIQNGCDHRCTFCVIPYGRGNSRSTRAEDIIKNIRNALDNQVKEIVLTGVDLTSWGNDFSEKKSLGSLLKIIFKEIPDLPRLRISSLDPAEIDHDFMDVLETQENLMPHLHLSIQHGDNIILKRMKRRHLFIDVINFVKEAKLRRPDVVFGGDFISGFPTENEEAHKNSIKLIKEAEINFAHIFPFSPRNGTPAAKMKGLSKTIINQRSKELRELSQKNTNKFLNSLIGTIQKVLVEKNNTGYTPQFAKVKLDGNLKPGNIIDANVIGMGNLFLIGSIK